MKTFLLAAALCCPALALPLPPDLGGAEPMPLAMSAVLGSGPVVIGDAVDPPSGADAGAVDREPPPPPPPAASSDPAGRLLDELERSARDLEAFTASVIYRTEDALLGARSTQKGELIYRVEPERKRKTFAILFDTTIVDGRRRERLKHWIFADGWLIEIEHNEKLFIKRQIVRPGETFDPLKLGEGPIPLPIGQPRAEVLERFEVALIDLPEDGLLAKLRATHEVDGLRLVPRAGTREAEDFARVDLFYDRLTRLPVGIDVTEINGDRKTARLGDLRRNPPLDPALLRKLDVREPDPRSWRIDVRPLEPRP